MPTLYAATGSPGKLREFATSASADAITVLALPNLASITAPEETATTFLGNAELKARAYSLAAPNLYVFADDSGLAVDALNGTPGVRSARFADDAGFPQNSAATTDDRNNQLLLDRLAQSTNRTANFRCALALARNGEILLRAEGACAGEILREPRGANGFGYDPLFFLPQLGRTMAELAPDEKWNVSHRGNAFRSLLRELRLHPLKD